MIFSVFPWRHDGELTYVDGIKSIEKGRILTDKKSLTFRPSRYVGLPYIILVCPD